MTVNDYNETIDILFQVILSNGFSRLQICTTVGILPLVSSETWTKSSALHLNMKDLFACPNLRRFISSSSSYIDPIKDTIVISLFITF